MGLRYLGNIIKPGYNPLASNITTGVNVVQYQGVFTAQQQLQAQANQQWSTDPLFDYSTLLLQADSIANGSQNNTFLDSSTNNFTITRNGGNPGMTQGTFSPFSLQPGAWSNFFNGSNAYLSIGSNAVLAPGTGNFWVECWINLSNLPSSGTTYAVLQNDALGVSTNDKFWFGVTNNAGTYRLQVGRHGTSDASYVNWTPSIGVWYHIAYGRSSGTSYLFIDGVSQTVTGSLSGISFGQNGVVIGAVSTPYYFPGYISNLRYIVGAVLYTSTFTPSTTPLTTTSQGASSSQVEILTCQDNRFVDNSTNAFTITANGTPSVQAFSPFAPQYQYTASGTGGSGYFDGSGDYLTTGTASALNFGTGNFTIEAWYYLTSTTNLDATLIADGGASYTSTSKIFKLYWSGQNFPALDFGSGNGSVTANNTAARLNQWNHVALVRSGNTFTMYLNGVAGTPVTFTGSVNFNGNNNTFVGFSNYNLPTNGYFTGWISGLRAVTSAVYSANFIPPTAPPTAITNTQLLLNFTNAGILDGTMKNNLETVADAKVSTSVVKYGSGSISLDGSGDYVVEPTNVNFGYGTGDFTIEFWLYVSSFANDQTVFSNLTSASSTNPHIYIDAPANVIKYYTANADRITGSVLNTGQWYHIAVCRSNANTRLFINGAQSGSTYADTNDYGTSAPLGIGTYWTAGAPSTTSTLNGYMDDIRVTKGIARYTQNFIPPSVALPRQ